MAAMAGQATARISQVPEQLSRLQKATDELHARLDGLSERLNSVLRPSTPTPEGKTSEVRQHLTVLAENLQGVVETIQAATSKVDSLIGRIEL